MHLEIKNVCICKEQRGPYMRRDSAKRYQICQEKTAKNEPKHNAIALHMAHSVSKEEN